MCIYKQTLWSVSVIVHFKVHTSLFGSNFPWHNDCSPVSYLTILKSSYLVSFLWGKMQKGWKKSLMRNIIYLISHYSFTWNTQISFFGHIPWIWQQQFGSVQRPYKQYSTIVNTISLQFCVCLAIFSLLTIFGNAHRPCKQYPNIVDNSWHHVYTVFLILWLYFH